MPLPEFILKPCLHNMGLHEHVCFYIYRGMHVYVSPEYIYIYIYICMYVYIYKSYIHIYIYVSVYIYISRF